MKCRAIPYQGQEPFIFFSYCHKDSARVYPLIENLTEQGYRIWFDDGISIGDEWPETIAEKLEKCTLFLAAITPDYCCSHNCKNEMTYQVEDKKPMLPLLLEDFPLIGGIKLQLSGTQYLRLYERPEESWASEVASAAPMAQCKGAPMVLQPPETENKEDVLQEIRHAPQTESPAEAEKMYTICIESGRVSFSREGRVILTPGQQLPGPILTERDGKILLDNQGAGQVTVEQSALKPGQSTEISPGTMICAGEYTYLPVSEKKLEELRQQAILPVLKAESTGELQVISSEGIHLGRNYPWGQNLWADRKISRHHADILPAGDSVEILDCSKNGTYVNEERLNGTAVLKDGDEIRMGNERFHYRQIPLDFSDEARESSYCEAAALLEKSHTEEALSQAEHLFAQLGAFRDCGMLQLRCKERLEAIRQEKLRQKEAAYQQAIREMEHGDYHAAREKLEQLGDYKDAEAQLEHCAYLAARHGDDLTADDDEKTIREEPEFQEKEELLIVELHTGQTFRGKPQATLIGRKINQCDIPFPDNGRMSRRHTELFTLKGEHYVRDCDSSNGTWLNGQMLEQGQTVKIQNTALLNLAGTWLLAAFDDQAAELRRQGCVAYLQGEKTLILGRKDRQKFLVEDPDATILNGYDTRCSCADFWQDADGVWLEVRNSQYVRVNGQTKEPGEPTALKDGDEVQIADDDYCFRRVPLIRL